MSQVKFNGRAVICLILMAISLAAVLIALKWPMQTALFPIVIGIALFLLSVPTLVLILTGKGESSDKQSAVDRELSDHFDEATTRRKTLGAFTWVIGFFLLILCLGFPVAVPVFALAYTRFQGKEKWWISSVTAFFCWLFIWGLFIRLLHISFEGGLIQQGLNLLGIG